MIVAFKLTRAASGEVAGAVHAARASERWS